MAGALLAGLSSKALGASKMVGGASKMAGASKIGFMPKTFAGAQTRLNVLSSFGGGSGGGKGGISPSKFSSTSTRSKIGNIAGSVGSSGGSGGIGDMLTSESIMGRRTGQDTTQDFLNTFGSDKTGKVIRSSLMVLRDTFVETFETARILRTALSQMDGLGGGAGGKGGGKKGKGGGLLGMLGSMLMSPLGMIGAGIGGGLLAKKFGGLKGLKGLFGKGGKFGKKVPITRSKVPITGSKSKNLFNDTFGNFDKAGLDAGKQMNIDKVLDPSSSSKIGSKSGKETFENLMGKPPVDDVAEGTAKVTQNVTKSTNVVKEGIKKGSKGGGILGKGKNIAKNLFKNPKKALGAGILGIGGLALGMHVVGRTGEDTWDRFDGVIDKFDSVLDEQSKDKKVRSTSQNAVAQGGQVVSGNMSQNDYEKFKLESRLEDAIEIHGYNSPEANEIQKRMMVLSGTPAEAIYTDPEGKLQLKSFSSFDGKTSVGGVKKKKKKGGGFGLKRMIGGAADISTMGMFDFDKRSGGGLLRKTAGAIGSGIKRGVGGALDFATLGMFDFDKRNRKGAPKDFGIRRIAGGLADHATMGLTDFDKRGRGNLQFNPIGGGKDKAWGAANEQAKRGEKQSGFGLKRGIGGALDFATLGMFDFDKQNPSGAPKGFGIKRIVGGLADAITMGTTDFDKRGAGFLQYSGFTGGRKSTPPTKRRVISSSSSSISSSGNQEGIMSMLSSGNRSKIQQGLYQMRISAAQGSGKGMNDWVGNPKYDKDVDLILEHGIGSVEINGGKVKLQTNAKNVKTTPQNTSVPKDPKKNVKVVNIPSPTSGGETNSPSSGGGATVNPSGSSGAGSQIPFPSSHNGVSYAAVETQSQMNLVMAD